MTAAVWDRYETVLLPLVNTDPGVQQPTQLDLFDLDDDLSF